MKKIFRVHLCFFIAISVAFLSQAAAATAQSPTKAPVPTKKAVASDSATVKTSPTPTPGESIIDKLKQIQDLKEKIATKVAQIREKDKTGIMGTVKKADAGQIILTTLTGEKTVTITDDVQIFTFKDGKKATSTVRTIKDGSFIAVVGHLTDGKTVAASALYIQSQPDIRITGKIADIDRTNFTVTVKGKEGETIVDIEKVTKAFLLDTAKKTFAKSGFSKLAVGATVHVFGSANEEEKNRISALSVYALPFDTDAVAPSPAVASDSAKTTSAPTKKPTQTPQKATPTPKI